MKTRKAVWLLALVAALLASTMAACSKDSNGSGGASSKGKVTLEFIRWSNGPALDAEETDKIKRFNESHPNIEVKMTLLPWDETFRKIELSLASSKPVDLFYWDVPAYAWYKKGLFKNLQPYFDKSLNMSEFDEKLFEPLKFDGENMYIAPENYQTLLFYYNKSAFDTAGIDYPNGDWTWDDVLDAARKLTVSEGGKTSQYGFDAASLGVWWSWMALSWAQGGNIIADVHEPEAVTLDTPENAAALQFLQDMIYKEKVAPDVATKDANGMNFQTGKLAMYVGGDWDLGTLKEITDFEWGVAPIPKWGDGRATPYFVGGYVMAENTKHPDEAWEFIKWAMTDNQETIAKQQSWIPVHNPSREKIEAPEWAPEGYLEARFEWLKDGRIGDIYHLKWREANDKYMTPMQDEIFINGGDVKQALAKAEKEINALLQSE
ncbi:ABC transporter substrate-binding protein [Cohnella cellulosilytica]|uniref:ABC transporter substrate-binding protein n=1 Tax=Cohnella cellulosilytica TaxID=986710 RepID=A0ABW2FIK9_9BACL